MRAAAWAAAGVPLGWALGWLFFASLHASVRALLAGAVLAGVARQILRLAGLALALGAVARFCPPMLWGTLPGLLVARQRVLRDARNRP